MKAAPIRILLVEDSEPDVDLTREALKHSGFVRELQVCGNGHDALARLRLQGPYAKTERAQLVILDLNLPGLDGKEVLKEIKSDPQLRHIPVIVLTSSRSERDIRCSYELHASCFVTKPGRYRAYLEVLHRLEDFWAKVAEVPKP